MSSAYVDMFGEPVEARIGIVRIMAESYYGLRIFLLFVILAANGFFAAAEVSLLTARKSRLRQLANEGDKGAEAALSLLANPERLLSATQVGARLAILGLGWAGEDTIYTFVVQTFHGLMSYTGGLRIWRCAVSL
jgi:CBS domain containing-hemolysin-like protein